VIAEPDARDWHALPYEVTDYRIGLGRTLQGLVIAASADLGHLEVDPEIRACFEAAITAFTELGATVEAVDPGIASPRPIFARTWFPAAAHVLRLIPEDRRGLVDPGLADMAQEGVRSTPADLYTAEAERRALGIHMQRFFERYDLLLTPTVGVLPFTAGQEVPDRARYPRWIDWAGFSFPFNLTQQPAASVPMGFSKGGLPMGLQIVGPKYADALVLNAAHAFESARPGTMQEEPRVGEEKARAERRPISDSGIPGSHAAGAAGRGGGGQHEHPRPTHGRRVRAVGERAR